MLPTDTSDISIALKYRNIPTREILCKVMSETATNKVSRTGNHTPRFLYFPNEPWTMLTSLLFE